MDSHLNQLKNHKFNEYGKTRKIFVDGPSSQYVKLNVGGQFFTTTIGTLTSRDTMLRAMFSGKMEVLTDDEGWVLIDRSGKYFGAILNWLRDGDIPLPELRHELEELAMESKFYLAEELLQKCEAALPVGREFIPACSIPYIVSAREENQILSLSSKPLIKLQVNRHNNKYSYTQNSDDNLLKSLELLDKLALKFNGRIVFFKDIIGSSEICCWSFYGNNKKIAEVCCTSIVYTSDKGKHTKVEFPEARILEETLNVLLYEKPHLQPDIIEPRNRIYPGYVSEDEEERSSSQAGYVSAGPSNPSRTSRM